MTVSDFTIGDLLADPAMGLTLATDDANALRRPVVGAHSIELEDPGRWLEPGWMMLTMGVRLRNKPALQRQLVADLKDLEASCLGLGVGLAFKSVPPTLLEEANRLGLPVVTIPEDTQFREVTRTVFESTVGIDSATFRRLSSLQQNLGRAFADENPLESIVRRLGRLVNAVVAVVTEAGDTVVTTGALPVGQITAGAIADYTGLIKPIMIDDWRVLASPINDMRGRSSQWLILASQQSTAADDLARAAIQVALPLLDAQLRMSATARNQDRAIRRSLLDALLDGNRDELETRMLAERVGAVGIRIEQGVRVAVLRGIGKEVGGELLSSCASQLGESFEQISVPHLLSVRPTEIVLAAEPGRQFDNVLQGVLAQEERILIGIGRTALSPEDVKTAWRDGQMAVQHMSLQGNARMLAFEDLDLVTQILAEVPVQRLESKVSSMAQLLKEHPIQLAALRAYFLHNRDIKAAAAGLHVHPNTLRYRLERFEAGLGRSLQEPATIASIYCLLTLMPDDDA